MATIQKRKDSFLIRVSGGYDVKGKQIIFSQTWKPTMDMTERQIEKALNKEAVKFEEDCLLRGQATKTVKFQDFAEDWLKERETLRDIKRQTFVNYQWLSNRIFKTFGHMRLDKINVGHIQKFINGLSGDGRQDGRNGKLSAKSVKLHFSLVSTILEHAVKMGHIPANPCRLATLPKQEKKKLDMYSLEEAQAFLDMLMGLDDEEIVHKLFFVLAMYTGFRRGEILGLEWQDFDFDHCMVHIERASYYTSKTGVITDTPKTSSSNRTLKLPQAVFDLIERYRAYQQNYIAELGDKWQDTERLFTKWNGQPMHPDTPIKFMHRFCDRNGLRYVNIHSFRHFNASVLINNGVDVKTVQMCLGHSSSLTTLDIYAQTFQSAQVRAMEAVANSINFKI